jgi:hypothetical protein
MLAVPVSAGPAPAKKPAKTGKASAAFDIDMKGIEDILRKRGI